MQMGHKNGTSENNSLTWNRASLQDVEPEKKKLSVYFWTVPGCHRKVANNEFFFNESNINFFPFQNALKCSSVIPGH